MNEANECDICHIDTATEWLCQYEFDDNMPQFRLTACGCTLAEDVRSHIREPLADDESEYHYSIVAESEYGRRYLRGNAYDEPIMTYACHDQISGERFSVHVDDVDELEDAVEEYIRDGIDADTGSVAYDVVATDGDGNIVSLSGVVDPE